jgi:hypothetical protein
LFFFPQSLRSNVEIRISKPITDVRITQFLDFVRRPEFQILENSVSETGSVSALR